MNTGKAGDADALLIDLIKDAGDFVRDKIAILFTKCLQTCSVLSTWSFFLLMLINQKEDMEDLEKFCPLSLLSVMYKLFTNVFMNRITATLYSN